VTAFGHVAGVPLEELLAPAGGAGASLVLARAWLSVHLRRRRKPGSRAVGD
jgi:hypothetical protein